MAGKTRHHVVSRGYQRLFADGELIAIQHRDGGDVKVIGTADAFVEKHFSSYTAGGHRFAELEDEWARVEGQILPTVRMLAGGEEAPNAREHVRVLAALHFVRSYSFDTLHDRIIAASVASSPGEIAAEPAAQAAWRADYGKDPQPGDIEAIVEERFAAHFATGAFRIEQMAEMYNKVLKRLSELHVQLVSHPSRQAVPSVPFIIGDTPVVHWSKARTGLRDGLAFMDGDHVWFPLSPALAAMFTTKEEGDQVLPSTTYAQSLNHRVWRASWRYIAGHPTTDFDRALARS